MITEDGITLRLWIGPSIPAPPAPELTESLKSVEVSHSDGQRSAFQLSFLLNRSGPMGSTQAASLLKASHQVHLSVIIKARPRTLINGVITNREVSPGDHPGQTRMTVTGEDQSWYLDKEETSTDHVGQSDAAIVAKIISNYADRGLVPNVTPPNGDQPRNPVESAPTQQGSDLEHLRSLASKHGSVFYINPKSAPYASEAYWGPPVRSGSPQPPLNVNLGTKTNVENINFRENQNNPTQYEGYIQDRNTNEQMPVPAMPGQRTPLSSNPPWIAQTDTLQKKQIRLSATTMNEALSQAQARTDQSTDDVVRGTGSLDPIRYGEVLEPRKLVGLRGVGSGFDGTYYVKQVTHSIERGKYLQNFVITREGTGSISPVLPV